METPHRDAVEQLRAELAARRAEYVLLSPLPDTLAHVRFLGRFEGREVAWDMTLYTLARHAKEHGETRAAPADSLRGLMHIEPAGPDRYRLRVALRVPIIDEPVVRKTIVMIGNYRRLRPGLRTWGEAGDA